jgi:chemotaxis protein methyltransferase CheR
VALQIASEVPSAAGDVAPYDPELERIEIELLLEGIFRHYGFDFRSYAYASIRRRLWKRIEAEGLGTVSALQARVLHEPELMERLLLDLSINVTAMFRDPAFYRAFREHVIPILRTYPFIRIWHAGCSTGEEVYSTAIMLEEEGLLERTRIYATDINDESLRKAQSGVYALDRMKQFTLNHRAAGGPGSLSDYYHASHDSAIMATNLKQHITFADHSLATDSIFSEVQLVSCRNVLIYFARELQDRALALFNDALCRRGFLCLGTKESVRFSSHAARFQEWNGEQRIYRRVD